MRSGGRPVSSGRMASIPGRSCPHYRRRRRYDPADLLAITAGNHLELETSAPFGMQPANPRLVKLGMWYLEHRRALAMFWYNWVGMPLAKRFQKRLKFVSGLIDTTGVD